MAPPSLNVGVHLSHSCAEADRLRVAFAEQGQHRRHRLVPKSSGALVLGGLGHDKPASTTLKFQ